MTLHKPKITDEDQEIITARAISIKKAFTNLMRDLVSLRKQKNYSLGFVGDRMGVSVSAVAEFENYDSNPKLGMVYRYALAIGAKIDFSVIADQENYQYKSIELKYKVVKARQKSLI